MTQGNAVAEWLVNYGMLSLEVIGTLAFAVSGIIEAARKKLDIVGFVMVSFLTAFGGGTLRDVLLDRRPFFWVQNEVWIWILIAICVFALVFLRARHLEPTARATAWPDAVGLGVFGAGGTQIALSMQISPIVAVLMGVITAVVGGILRDVVVNEIPRAFSDSQPYSVLAFIGGWSVVILNMLDAPEYLSVSVGAFLITGLRIASMLAGWKVPTWRAK